MILYIEDPRESMPRPIRIKELVGYKIHVQNSIVFLYLAMSNFKMQLKFHL